MLPQACLGRNPPQRFGARFGYDVACDGHCQDRADAAAPGLAPQHREDPRVGQPRALGMGRRRLCAMEERQAVVGQDSPDSGNAAGRRSDRGRRRGRRSLQQRRGRGSRTRQAVALAELGPRRRDSGSPQGRSSCGGGHRERRRQAPQVQHLLRRLREDGLHDPDCMVGEPAYGRCPRRGRRRSTRTSSPGASSAFSATG